MNRLSAWWHNRRVRHAFEVLIHMDASEVEWWGGWELSRSMHRRSGVLYPALQTLLDAEEIEAMWETSEPVGRPPRRFYRVVRK